ncbi:hypothetical protein F5Y16DRAFT_405852 [Xylariaceae sp. FL0255]|nr:hypothetical protein F5Y16DRAFT_405852 [Xylariaceae sp. FL0255]
MHKTKALVPGCGHSSISLPSLSFTSPATQRLNEYNPALLSPAFRQPSSSFTLINADQFTSLQDLLPLSHSVIALPGSTDFTTHPPTVKMAVTNSGHWQVGQIAFLKDFHSFSDDGFKLIRNKSIPRGACKHPVIILARSQNGAEYIVTTVSAYSSGPTNNHIAPWRWDRFQHLQRDGFRAFKGSQRPDADNDYLKLRQGQSWPKPLTSWVYIHHTYKVTSSMLGVFTRVPGLQMTQHSINALIMDISGNSDKFLKQQRSLVVTPKPKANKNYINATTWRSNIIPSHTRWNTVSTT